MLLSTRPIPSMPIAGLLKMFKNWFPAYRVTTLCILFLSPFAVPVRCGIRHLVVLGETLGLSFELEYAIRLMGMVLTLVLGPEV